MISSLMRARRARPAPERRAEGSLASRDPAGSAPRRPPSSTQLMMAMHLRGVPDAGHLVRRPCRARA